MDYKKLLVLLLVSLVALFGIALSGCTQQTKEEPKTEEATPAEEPAAEEPAAEEPAAEEPAKEGAGGDAAAGKELYTSKGCGACHANKDAGATGTVGPTHDGVGSKLDAAAIEKQLKTPSGTMPPFTGTDQELKDLVEYLLTLK